MGKSHAININPPCRNLHGRLWEAVTTPERFSHQPKLLVCHIRSPWRSHFMLLKHFETHMYIPPKLIWVFDGKLDVISIFTSKLKLCVRYFLHVHPVYRNSIRPVQPTSCPSHGHAGIQLRGPERRHRTADAGNAASRYSSPRGTRREAGEDRVACPVCEGW